MGFLDNLVDWGRNLFTAKPAVQPGEPGPGIAQLQVPYEVTTPQYPQPQPYAVATNSYRLNELAYACIRKRYTAIGEPGLAIWDGDPDDPATNRLDDHPAKLLLKQPNDFMSESMFWQATELYLDVAGYAIWEIEFNKLHEPMHLYPMRPDWCSFRRGPDKLLQYVRYQPYGLPYADVPVERLVVFMDLDPIWQGLRPVGRAAVALRSTTSDNAATDFLTLFFQRGAQVAGLLSTEQSLQDAEARRIREQWREAHGGYQNWTDVAVVGAGTKFQQVGVNFKDMDFANIDGRDEARVCMVFDVPPILLGAKVGLSASTYSNYREARMAWYEESIQPAWAHYAGVIERQLLPHYGENLAASFDVRHVKALQEDRTAMWQRAGQAAAANLITRDEARTEMGLDPIDEEPVFVGVTVRTDQPAAVEEKPPEPPAQQPPAQSTPTEGEPEPEAEPEMDTEAMTKALTAWRRFCVEAVKAGRPAGVLPFTGVPDALSRTIQEALKGCKTASDVRAVFERHWPKPAMSADIGSLVSEVRAAREALEALEAKGVPA